MVFIMGKTFKENPEKYRKFKKDKPKKNKGNKPRNPEQNIPDYNTVDSFQ